jgi:hypothetical protein
VISFLATKLLEKFTANIHSNIPRNFSFLEIFFRASYVIFYIKVTDYFPFNMNYQQFNEFHKWIEYFFQNATNYFSSYKIMEKKLTTHIHNDIPRNISLTETLCFFQYKCSRILFIWNELSTVKWNLEVNRLFLSKCDWALSMWYDLQAVW